MEQLVELQELRDAINFMKEDSGSGTKARKQDRFREVYNTSVAHLVAGERYDDAGVGPKTAQSAVEAAYPDLDTDEFDTISEALTTVSGKYDEKALATDLVTDLDALAEMSGDEQKELLVELLESYDEPSFVTLALLDDENIGLGTSQMRDAFHDGTRDERKRSEAFTDSTADFIRLARNDELPDSPTVGEAFSPMLAVSESRGEPENPVAQMKIDGYRILIHLQDGEATAFSRAENDVTPSLPELQEIEFPDGDYILDAEVIAATGSYSDTSERIGRKAENVERDVEMHFEVFDCVVYQGDDVTQSPFNDRFDMAMEIVNATGDDRLNILPVISDIDLAKDRAMSQDYEGIIVKNNEAPYEFKRSAEWQKQKYDAETIDLKIVGFNEGDGESSGTLGAIELETSDGVFVGNSGSGFSDEQCDRIWNNQDEWLGRCVEVEGRGVGSEDKIRMPIFKRDRSDDGEPDSWDRVQEIMKDV